MAEQEHQDHYYGGQAVIEGVMMRGLDKCAIAVRRMDGQIVMTTRNLGAFAATKGWLKWPLIRGNLMLVETLALGMSALQFSADVLAAEEQEKLTQEQRDTSQAQREPQPATGINRLLMTLTMVFAIALGLGLFIVLPTWAIGFLPGFGTPEGVSPTSGFLVSGSALLKNIVEGIARLTVVVLYIVAISMMKYVRRVFEYHGAEHATINCFEAGEPVTPSNCLKYATLHPRCGTAFLLVVILVKIVLGWFFGWPSVGMRILIRLALLPPVAGIAYEIIRWAGRHRHSLLANILAWPGMMMQLLTTRRPDEGQAETAIYALAAVAPEVGYPADGPTPLFVDAKLRPVAVGASGADSAGIVGSLDNEQKGATAEEGS